MTNSLEISTLKIFLKKENYIKYISIINNINLTKEIELLINLITKYYSKFTEHTYIAPDELENFFLAQYPQIKDLDFYNIIFHQLRTLEVSDSLASDIIKKYLARDWAGKTINFLLPIADGSEESERLFEIPNLFDSYKETIKAQEETSSPFVEYTPGELFGFSESTEGLSWPLPGLDEVLGRLPRRTLGHVFARVETGKTTFISHCITHWAYQLFERKSEELVIGFFNEENGRRISSRLYHSLLNKTPEECDAYRERKIEELQNEYNSAGGSLIRVLHDPLITINRIKEILENYPVRAIVIDIADHVKYAGDNKVNTVERLNHLYREYRTISDKYNIDVLTCGQAGEVASSRKNLFLEHMYDSKTAKPGALDYAIGIGAIYDEPDRRWLCVAKNKLKSSGYRVVDSFLDRERGRYVEV